MVVFGYWDLMFFCFSSCLPWFTWLALALVRCMGDCNARFVVGTRVFEQLWSSGDGMWLFPTLIFVIAGHSVVLSWCAYGFSHRRVGLVMLYESPRWSPG